MEIDNSVDGNSDIVFGDDFLFGNIEGVDTNINFDDALQNRDDELESGAESVGINAQSKDNTALILVDNNN